MNIVQSFLYKIKSRLNNNILNRALISIGFEKHIKVSGLFWKNYVVDRNKTEQEIAGYSHISSIDEAIIELHMQLQSTTKKYFNPDVAITILDIGCGPGLYLKDFPKNANKYGIDLNRDMLKLAKKNNSDAVLIEGEFLKVKFTTSFHMLYSIGVLQYFTPAELDNLLKKASSLLQPSGILFISYPHAISREDLSYPDINYISYSPGYLSRVASKYFTIISNKHILQDRTIDEYDISPASPPVGFNKTYQNSSILIAQKK